MTDRPAAPPLWLSVSLSLAVLALTAVNFAITVDLKAQLAICEATHD